MVPLGGGMLLRAVSFPAQEALPLPTRLVGLLRAPGRLLCDAIPCSARSPGGRSVEQPLWQFLRLFPSSVPTPLHFWDGVGSPVSGPNRYHSPEVALAARSMCGHPLRSEERVEGQTGNFG